MTTYAARLERPTMPWWLVLLEGISLLVVGFLLVSAPAQTTVITVQIIGLYWLIGGILHIVGLFVDRTAWGWKLFSGILGVLAGIVVLQHPLWSPLVIGSTIIIILGFQGIFYGAIGLVQAFQGGGWGAAILGVVSILFGLLLLTNVWIATISLPWTIGILAIVGGIASIVAAFRLR